MSFLYHIIVFKVSVLLRVIALFNDKIRLFVKGRDVVWETLENGIDESFEYVWFHAASLGEFEQGVPVMKKYRAHYPGHKILLTFFSPSGYEVRKETPLADVVCYLPLDTPANVKRFLQKVKPVKAFFIKYEYWPNYLKELKQKSVPTYIISGIFSQRQVFFKWYGGVYRKCLDDITHFFVQDLTSKALLNQLGKHNVDVSGDTRFDRVLEILEADNRLGFVEEFVEDKLTVVIGSSWPKDEEYLMSYINACEKPIKWIIAPHNIKPDQIEQLHSSCSKDVILFSQKEGKKMSGYDVFIVDTIGLLTKIYSYGTIAYVGGGFENGIHNVLEPATFGMPVLIGPKFQKFKEAVDLVEVGGCVSVSSENELHQWLDKLIDDAVLRNEKSTLSQNFVKKHAGATNIIMQSIRK
ncbi:MAG: 3-deoxy-D-manno-octulosonic acid transferase [Flavobacteriales bacterium]|nr:3-deoxy-D-manno-octulosonic acid transferase [Flavobacteriales bacterium]